MNATSQLPPHSIEAEQALLGAILIEPAALDVAENIVTAADFFEPLHQTIFELLAKAKAEGRRVSYQIAVALLSEQFKNADVVGMTVSQYMARLVSEATTIINAPDYARVIAEHADRRRILAEAETMTEAARGCADLSPAKIALETIESLDNIAARYSAKHAAAVSFDTAADRSLQRMQTAIQNGGRPTGILTGLRALDVKLGGVQRGDLIIFAGRPGMGKSGVAISALRQAAQAGASGLLFALEMSAENVSDRMLSDALYDERCALAYFDIARGLVSDDQAEKLFDAKHAMRSLSIKIDPQGGLNASQIGARARRHKQALEAKGRTLDLVIVDHLHIMRASERYRGNRVAEITEISAALKALAKELNVPLVALAQLSRAVEARDDKRPMLSDLRDSGSLEQDADVILFAYREAYYLQAPIEDAAKEQARIARLLEVENRLELDVAKQRNGPTGRVELFFNPACNAARDLGPLGIARAAA